MKASQLVGAFLALICSWCLAAQSADAVTHWYVDAAGCKLATANPVDLATPIFKFTGTCVDGFVAGTGVVAMLDGSGSLLRGEFQQGRLVKGVVETRQGTFEGDMLDSQLHGQGTFTALDGLTFKGRFERGRPVGSTGEVTWPAVGRYAGALDVRTLSPLGNGIMHYTNGAVLVGEFMEDDKTVGTLKNPDGTVAQGTFVGGVLTGHGKIEWLSGARYEGEVRASQPSGRGHMERPTGEIYDGDFIDGYYHGKGTLKTGHGDVYVGDFVLGKRHGNGELTNASGNVRSGEWIDDLQHGKCRIIIAPEKYEGNCSGGSRDGYGHWESSANNEFYEGNFKANRFDGKGKLRRGDYVYEGTFKQGAKDGTGKEADANGSYEGGFAEGLRHGRGSLRVKAPDGSELHYDGEFAQGVMAGAGVLSLGELKFDGTFEAGEFVGGKVVTANGRVFEVDKQTGGVLEVLKDGSKRSLDQLPADLTT